MAIINAEIKLKNLSRTVNTTMNTCIYFPTDLPEDVGNEVKGVITLLHGMSNTASDWFYMSAAARYAADNGYILIAPSVGNSFYSDMKYGAAFYTAVTEELPQQLNKIFKIPTNREQNYICGLSMGGYGALKIALSHPERYAAAGSFSGSLDMQACLDKSVNIPSFYSMFASIFGEQLALPKESDLFYLAQNITALDKNQQPKIFCTCGKQDNTEPMFIRQQNKNFEKVAEKANLDYTYIEWDGVHEWNFWDRSLVEFIGFIQNSEYNAIKKNDWNAPASNNI